MILQHVVGPLEREVWWVWAADILPLKLPSNPPLNRSRQIHRVSRNPFFSVATSSRPKSNQGTYQLGIYLPALTETLKLNNIFFNVTVSLQGAKKGTVFYSCCSISSSVMASFSLHVTKLLLQIQSSHLCFIRRKAKQCHLWESISPSKGISMYYWPETSYITSPRCQGLWAGEGVAWL